MLPGDPVMLMSIINMKLRDTDKSREELFEDMDWSTERLSREDVERKLNEAGFVYDPERNMYRQG